jgi:FlaA1/EpsC-like NDP-sugar epimerase
MTRYFMTIPEAVQLIIRSGSLASTPRPSPPGISLDGRPRDGRDAVARPGGADVYVLDMGEPVSILELAREMIQLSGLDPDRDIEIEIVGRRPGEKLHEALFNGYERLRPTAAEKILLAEHDPLGGGQVEAMFAEIGLLVLEGDAAGLAAKVSELSAYHREPETAKTEQPHEQDRGVRDGWPQPAREAPAALIHSRDS